MNMTILIGAAAVVLIIIVLLYNRLVTRKNQVENAFGSIDSMLKKRLDLIPNLVAAVKQFMTHERGLLERVTELRAQALKPGLPVGERIEVERGISRALSGIMVAVENYPQLRSNENMLQLQAALNEVEEQISAARRFYNSAVTDYNNALETFPSNLVASAFRFERRRVFEIAPEERQAPEVGKLFA